MLQQQTKIGLYREIEERMMSKISKAGVLIERNILFVGRLSFFIFLTLETNYDI
jgi:hypothetical protein